MSESEMIAEPDWLAAEPSARAKLTAIMAAVRRCYAECSEPQLTPPTGPHLSTTMAEVFIGQLLMTATDDAGDLTPAGMYLEGVRAERERIRELVSTRFKVVLAQPDNGYLVDAVPFAAFLDVLAMGDLP